MNISKTFPSLTPSGSFLILSLLFGGIYVLLVPPFQSPDEAHHFFKAYHISTGHLYAIKTEDNRLGGYLPKGLTTFADQFFYLRYQADQKTSFDSIVYLNSIALLPEDTVLTDFANVGYYSPIPYLPQAIGIAVFRPFSLSVPELFYVSRLFGLFCWIWIVLLAIRILPFHQWTFTLLALLPSTMFISSAISGDMLTNALSFWLIAYLLKIIYTKNAAFGSSQLLMTILVSTVIGTNKIVYFPIAALVFLIPKEKWQLPFLNHYFWKFLIMTWLVVILYVWTSFLSQVFIPYKDYHPAYRDSQQLNEGVDPMAQLDYIIQDPIQFVQIALFSYKQSAMATTAHYIGKFGWEGNYLPTWMILCLLCALLLVALAEKDAAVQLTWPHRWFFLCIMAIMTVLFTIVIYMQWSPVGNPEVLSLGGRYFIPILPLLFLGLQQHKWNLSPNTIRNIVLFAAVAGFIAGVWSVWQRYFLH